MRKHTLQNTLTAIALVSIVGASANSLYYYFKIDNLNSSEELLVRLGKKQQERIGLEANLEECADLSSNSNEADCLLMNQRYNGVVNEINEITSTPAYYQLADYVQDLGSDMLNGSGILSGIFLASVWVGGLLQIREWRYKK